MSYKEEEVAIREAKRDVMNILIGAFYIVEFPNGRFDYYPLGAWPTETFCKTTRRFVQFSERNAKWILIKIKKTKTRGVK